MNHNKGDRVSSFWKVLSDKRGIVKCLVDIFLWISVTPIAYMIRLDGQVGGLMNEIILVTALLGGCKIAAIFYFKSYRQSWRNSSFVELFQVIKKTALISILLLAAVLAFQLNEMIPLSIPILEFVLGTAVLVATRAGVRYMLKYRNGNGEVSAQADKRVLIAGAGESGANVVKEMLKHPKEGFLPVVFLDDNSLKHGQKIHGIPVAGSISEMERVVKERRIDEIIIAMPSETGDTIRNVVEIAQKTKVRHRIIPGMYDLVSGKVTINQIREVYVEDLLRRKQVKLQTREIQRYVEGQNVLVTGAGGSIGSEIVHQLSRFNPAKIILLGRGENSIYELLSHVKNTFDQIEISAKICDIRDRGSLAYVFETEKPDVIYHAAAHKHVPLMEKNPCQAILNNVKGTQNLVELALIHRVNYFVNISTDKAVNPSSIMGASKRISEHIVQAAASRVAGDKVFVSVRFGNVLGSRGSVIPIFKRQIKNGGPVTVTHPEMQRYFMTIPEASQLVLQAGALDQNGAVYLLDMGKPVNIEQMARDLIKLSGLDPDKDVKIKYTGVRPGEKLFEELATDQESMENTVHEKIFISKVNGSFPDLDGHLERLYRAAEERDKNKLYHEIKRIIPSFRRSSMSVAEAVS